MTAALRTRSPTLLLLAALAVGCAGLAAAGDPSPMEIAAPAQAPAALEAGAVLPPAAGPEVAAAAAPAGPPAAPASAGITWGPLDFLGEAIPPAKHGACASRASTTSRPAWSPCAAWPRGPPCA